MTFEEIISKTNKNNVACNADFGRAVALRVPRSAFLAEKQPPGASRSLRNSKFEKAEKTPQQCSFQPMAYSALMGIHFVFFGEFWNS